MPFRCAAAASRWRNTAVGTPATALRNRLPAVPAAQGFAAGGPRVGEVEVFDGDRADAMGARVADQPGDRMARLGIAACRGAGQVDVDAVRSAERVAVGVEAAQPQVALIEIDTHGRAVCPDSRVGFAAAAGVLGWACPSAVNAVLRALSRSRRTAR
jgi:hypothetical protein